MSTFLSVSHSCWACSKVSVPDSGVLLKQADFETIIEQEKKSSVSDRESISLTLDGSQDSKFVLLVKNFTFCLGSEVKKNVETKTDAPLALTTSSGKLLGPHTISKALAENCSYSGQLLGFNAEEEAEISQWLSLRNKSEPTESTRLSALNVYLAPKAVIVGSGTKISLADLGLFTVIYESVAALSAKERNGLPNLMRWFDYIQNKGDVDSVYDKIPVEKPKFQPPLFPKIVKASAAKPEKKSETTSENITKPDGIPEQPEVAVETKVDNLKANEPAAQNAGGEGKKAEKAEKKKKEKPPAAKKEVESGFSVLDVRVGEVKKVWKHPGADSLFVEEIDLGEAQPRQIVSGLAKFLTEEEFTGRKVAVLANVKQGKVRDILSSGLVLCASNEDHTKCEPIVPPGDAKVGERIVVEGHTGSPEEVLNPKKKQFDKIQPDLKTNSDGIATFQGLPLMTSAGPCSSVITEAFIK